MLKKTITYTDYDDKKQTDTLYFNLTAAELVEMQFGTVGGFAEMCEQIVNTKDMPKLITLFKELILNTYGEKSADGKRFMKSEEISNAFAQTEAYSTLFMELATDADKASDFINGVMPKEPKVNASN